MKLVKSLGLALCTCMALMGFTGVASASHLLETGAEPSALHGAEVEAAQSEFNFGGAFLDNKCSGISFEAPVPTKISTIFTTSSVGEGKCGHSVFKMNGCKFEFQPGSADRFNIGPFGCGAATLTIESTCVVTIPPQIGLSATYASAKGFATSGHTIETTPSKVSYTSSKCGLWGIPASGSNLSLHLKWNVTDTSTGGGELFSMYFAPWAGEEQLIENYCCGTPLGLSMQGEQLTSQWYPANVAGTQDASNKLKIELTGSKFSTECAGGALSSAQLSGPVSTFGIGGSYSSCAVSGGYTTNVRLNGCEYVIKSANQYESGHWHTEKAELGCPAGKVAEVEVLVGSKKCFFRIPGQALKGLQHLENQGSGTAAAVDVTLKSEGLNYTHEGEGILCNAWGPKEGSDLKLTNGILLKGSAP